MSLIFIPEETRVVLIGCSNFLEDTTLMPIKPIEANLSELKTIFSDNNIFNGIPEENITIVQNEKDYEIVTKVEEYSQLATDTLIVYYAGHGEREKGKVLYLTATNTRKDRLNSTAIEFERLNKIIQASKAPKKFIILDCCYSGLAAMNTEYKPLLEEELEDIQGTYIITSSPSTLMSYFHEREPYTFFTSELIHVLRNGVDNNAPFIEIGEIYEKIKANAKRKNNPLPMQKNTLNASGKVYFANNYRHIDYSKKVNDADGLLRVDEFESAFDLYKNIILEFNAYNNEDVESKMKSIDLIKNAERAFEQNKYEVANRALNSALKILAITEFKTGKILNEREKTYSLTSLMESKLREELKIYLTPLIRKDLEEELAGNPDLLEQKFREKLEQEYKIKTVGIERELRQKISQEYKDALRGNVVSKILLIVSANPIDTSRLRIDEEIREITAILKYNNNYQLMTSLATKANEIDHIILEITPEILHINVHAHPFSDQDGNNIASFCFEDDQGRAILINGKRLVDFIKIFPSIKLALMNTCHSAETAYQLSEFIPYTIGFLDAVDDKMCVSFAKSFYKALSSKEDIEFAYSFAVKACNLTNELDSKPILYKQENYTGKQKSNREKSINLSLDNHGDITNER